MTTSVSPSNDTVVAFALAAPTNRNATASTSECRASLGRACGIYGSQRVRCGRLGEGPLGQEAKGSEGLGQRAQLPDVHPTLVSSSKLEAIEEPGVVVAAPGAHLRA